MLAEWASDEYALDVGATMGDPLTWAKEDTPASVAEIQVKSSAPSLAVFSSIPYLAQYLQFTLLYISPPTLRSYSAESTAFIRLPNPKNTQRFLFDYFSRFNV